MDSSKTGLRTVKSTKHTHSHALFVQQRLKDRYIPEITRIDHYDGEKVEPPFSFPWYPDGLAWGMTTPKKIVRRYAPFASFQKFLVSETSVGNISRQEAVSMIPPLLLDVRSHMTVLDLCAAPGSKAAQLIEMVHAGEEASVRDYFFGAEKELRGDGGNDDTTDEPSSSRVHTQEQIIDQGRATGMLIANDADYKRSHMLIHQMKRLNSPNLIVTNHDATMFPSIRLPTDTSGASQSIQNRYLKFDRILADVPCSGDGTARKNPNVWKDWNPANALGLHSTQVRILVRALQMLKVGGRIVYSTCSMNPVENEAVVATAIDRCGGLSKVEILDCEDELPKLMRRPGLIDWDVMDKAGRTWKTWQEVEEHRDRTGIEGLGRLSEGMFPPPPSGDDNGVVRERIPLRRCMRLYAHLQDTGAFFVAVLEKLSEIRARPESEPKIPKPKPSIVAVAEEISARSQESTKPEEGPVDIGKLQTLDELVPPMDELVENPSAAVRQNQENPPTHDVNGPGKRDLSQDRDLADADALMSTKRLKIMEEPDEPAPQGEEDRQVHWPPPPAAQLGDRLAEPARTVSSKGHGGQAYEEPFKFLSPDHDEINSIYEFYDISPAFPKDRFMVRNALGEPAKSIYYAARLPRDVLRENEGKGIKFVHCGVKMFVKQDVQRVGTCKWRVQTEGLPILEPWVGEKRVVRLYKRETLRKLLIEMFPKVSNDSWQDLGEIGERVRDIELGCCVLRVEPSDGLDGFR